MWVLFSDAARLPLQQLRRDVSRYVRLLGVGLPLTIVFGWALAAWFFPQFGFWLALLVGAALAPTDAALGIPVVTNPAVPSRIRQLITVESGLNDGIATPVVMLAIAGAAAAAGLESAEGPGSAAVELLIGAGVGAAAGAAGGWLLQLARRRGTATEDFAGIGVLALSLLAYSAALAVGGNGFVAAFCAGLAFGTCAGQRGPAELAFVEQMSGLVSLLVWLAFGAITVPIMLAHFVPLTIVVCRAQPHGGAHAAGGAGLDWRRPRPEDRPVRGLVRPARPGFPRVRAAGAGSPRTSVRSGCGRHHGHRTAQRPGPRLQRRTVGRPLRTGRCRSGTGARRTGAGHSRPRPGAEPHAHPPSAFSAEAVPSLDRTEPSALDSGAVVAVHVPAQRL